METDTGFRVRRSIISDVAKKASVSIATVSKVINEIPGHYSLETKESLRDAYQLVERIIRPNNCPRAFFVASDTLAIGAMKAIRDCGRKVADSFGWACGRQCRKE